MLATLREDAFDSPDYIFEVKWGGVRAITEVDGHGVRLHGRNGRDLTAVYPELTAVAGCFDGVQAVFDGEIAAWGRVNLPSFELLRSRLLKPDTQVTASRRCPIVYHVFDLLELDGRSLLHRPLAERRNLLHERLQPNKVVQVADFVREEGVAFFEAVRSHGLEGIIAKNTHSPYLPGERSGAWQEVRATQSDEFVIGGYSFGGSRRKKDLIASLLLGAYRDGQLEFVGQVSVGCSDRETRQLQNLLTPLHSERCAFVEPPLVSRFLYWCRPELACHVRYSEWGADGRLRFPVFVAPRPDVSPEECTLPGAAPTEHGRAL